jgi:predicted ATPase/DNA-binding CsgD family transcriptional regulator
MARRDAPANLPVELTSFIGRERMLADIRRLLGSASAGCRLLTLTGPGGSGKTRLALQAAAAVRERFDDGVCFVALAPISDPTLVAATIAQTVGVRDAGLLAPLDGLKTYLCDRHLLLVLDNFEQVLGAATDVTELLSACPRLQVLVTSRAALRVSGERELVVAPLELPGRVAATAGGRGDDGARRCESVRLFVERARAVNADFALTHETAPAVAEICLRLDGLPLAIELAAARSRLLPPQAMLARLERRLQFLTGGARDLPTRQQTLRNTIAWSYDLLDPREQALFRTVAVFVGGCTLEAAQAVSGEPPAAPGAGPPAPDQFEVDTLDVADSLAAKSLLRPVVAASGEVRLNMLETTREFGLEQLAWSGELETLRRRHARYFLALAEHAEPELWGPASGLWLERLEAERDNIRAALDWCLSSGGEANVGTALRLAGALAHFWWTRGPFGEGRQWLARALEPPARAGAPRADAPERLAARMKALHGAGWLAHFQHDTAAARAALEESLAIAHELDDRRTVAWVLHVLGRVAYFDGDHVVARELAERSLAIAEDLGDRSLIGWALHLLGLAAHIAGDYRSADARYEQSLAIRQELGHRETIGVLYQLMGLSAHRQGEHAKALGLYREYLAIGRELGSIFHVGNSLAQFGALAATLGQPERAARLFGAAEFYHQTSGTRPIPLTVAVVSDGAELARETLGDRFAVAWAAGRALSSEQAIAEALAVELAPQPAGPRSTADRAARRAGPLSAREQEVAALVARGLTNRQIAAELVIAERTVAVHVEHILDKLGFRSRTQIGVWAAAQGSHATEAQALGSGTHGDPQDRHGNPRVGTQPAIGRSADARTIGRAADAR